MAVAKKDYKAIANKAITSPTQRKRPLRVFVYGRNKKGKTYFCTTPGKGKVLILDPENGTDQMRKADPDVWHITSWEDIDDVYKFIRSGEHDYEWIAIDGLTKIQSMALRWIINQAEARDLDRRPNLVKIQDYGNAGKMIEAMLYNFHQLPYGLIVTAQETTQEGNSSGDDSDDDAEDSSVYFIPHLQKTVRAAVNSMVDVIGRIYTVRTEVKVKVDGVVEEREMIQRRLWIEPHPQYDTGLRSDFSLRIPPYLKNPSIPRLIALITTGKADSRGSN